MVGKGEHPTESPDDVKIDGRTARRDRNRELVADAFLDLMSEGIAEPTHEMVAIHSGVSLRSVFRYWDDVDQMYRAVFLRAKNRVREAVPDFRPSEGDFETRCNAFVEHRVSRMLEAGNWGRVVRLREPIEGLPSELLEEVRTRVMGNIRAQFAVEFEQMTEADAETACAIVYQTCSYEGMDLLKRQLDFAPDQLRAAAMYTLKVVLT